MFVACALVLVYSPSIMTVRGGSAANPRSLTPMHILLLPTNLKHESRLRPRTGDASLLLGQTTPIVFLGSYRYRRARGLRNLTRLYSLSVGDLNAGVLAKDGRLRAHSLMPRRSKLIQYAKVPPILDACSRLTCRHPQFFD
jgi:hypothetical protein